MHVTRLLAGIRHVLVALVAPLMRTSFAHRFVMPYFPRLQLGLYRLSRGRLQLSELLVPSLVLHTTGARSGLHRETPLMYLPAPGPSYVVSGSNWGRTAHPAWTANLLADPDVAIDVGRRRLPMRADLLAGAERAAVWPALEAQWPNYRAYETAAGREMRIFRLTPR